MLYYSGVAIQVANLQKMEDSVDTTQSVARTMTGDL
jgi:hypothetical protein